MASETTMTDDTSQSLESTATLVQAIQGGDESARDRLMARCLPLLRRWAHGRLPHYGRDLAETDDIVQVSMIRALNNLDRFEARRPGAFLAYLRQILMNAVREEIRRTGRKPPSDEVSEDLRDQNQSVLDQAIGQETLDAYEQALEKLTDKQREAVVLRIEFGMSFPEIAAELGASSADAARMLVSRALVTLAEAMQ